MPVSPALDQSRKQGWTKRQCHSLNIYVRVFISSFPRPQLTPNQPFTFTCKLLYILLELVQESLFQRTFLWPLHESPSHCDCISTIAGGILCLIYHFPQFLGYNSTQSRVHKWTNRWKEKWGGDGIHEILGQINNTAFELLLKLSKKNLSWILKVELFLTFFSWKPGNFERAAEKSLFSSHPLVDFLYCSVSQALMGTWVTWRSC